MAEEAAIWMRDRLGAGRLEYGCEHYRRRCRIRAPCCNESRLPNPKERHELPRYKIERGTALYWHHPPMDDLAFSSVICSLCDTEQSVKQECENCGVNMGEYYCAVCNFFDDDVSKKQYHCDDCGICRVGGRDKFFHCNKCGCCYAVGLQKAHSCVENSMHHNCPVCFEYLFDSLRDITVMRCGHTMHMECLIEMKTHAQYSCPMCSKSICDMSDIWEQLDQEVAATPMPLEYQDKRVWILCNDCGTNSEVQFHIVARKCLECRSYNTRQIRGP